MSRVRPHVGIIMGSQSDWPTMKHAADILTELGILFETKIISAHRTPERHLIDGRHRFPAFPTDIHGWR